MLKRSIHGLLLLAIAATSVFAYSAYLGVGLFDRGGDGDTALIAKNILTGGISYGLTYTHPPFLYLVLVLSFFIGGYTEFAARFSVLAFFVIGGIFTFKIGKILHSSRTGVTASFLYFFSPLLIRGVFTFWMDAIAMVFMSASIYGDCKPTAP